MKAQGIGGIAVAIIAVFIIIAAVVYFGAHTAKPKTNSTTTNTTSINIISTLSVPTSSSTVTITVARGDGIGEVSGILSFNLTPGENQTQQWTIYDPDTTPLRYATTLPYLHNTQSDQTPMIVLSAPNGTIQSGREIKINVTVFMPNAEPFLNSSWNGILIAYVPQNGTGAGVGKPISIKVI